MSIEDDAKRALGWFEGHLPGQHAAAVATFTPAASTAQPQPEVPHMSALLDDAKKAASALVKHVETLASNPLVDTLVEVGAGIFLTPAEVIAVKAFVQALEADRAPASATAAAAQGVATAFQADSATQVQQTVQGAQGVAPAMVRTVV